jgi:hypothetical protein
LRPVPGDGPPPRHFPPGAPFSGIYRGTARRATAQRGAGAVTPNRLTPDGHAALPR